MKKLTQIFIITAVALLGYGFNAVHADAATCTNYYDCNNQYVAYSTSSWGAGQGSYGNIAYSNPLSWAPTSNPLSWTPFGSNTTSSQNGIYSYGQTTPAPVYYYQNTTNNTQLNQSTYNVYNPNQTIVPVTYAPTQQYGYPVTTTPYYPTNNPYTTYPYNTNTYGQTGSNLGTLIPDPTTNYNNGNIGNGNLGTLIPDPTNGTGTTTNNGNAW